MEDDDDKKAEIIDFLAAKSRRKQPQPSQPNIEIKGDGNIVGNHNTVIKTRKVVRKTVNKIQPGPEHISPAQARKLQNAVSKLVEIGLKSSDRSENQLYAAWYKKLKNRYDTNSYLLIPAESFDEALSWLQQHAAMNRPKLRRADPQSWRNEHYKAIYARAGELGLSKGQVYGLLLDKMGLRVTSLKQLSDKSLKRLYNIIYTI